MGYTQRWVTQLLGYRDTSMVSHYEHARALPPLAVALMLEIIYRVPVAFLYPELYNELKTRIRKLEEAPHTSGQRSLF